MQRQGYNSEGLEAIDVEHHVYLNMDLDNMDAANAIYNNDQHDGEAEKEIDESCHSTRLSKVSRQFK